MSDIEWQGYVVFDVRGNEVVAITNDARDAAQRAADHALEAGEEDFAWDAAFEGSMRPSIAIAANPPILRGHPAPGALSTAKIAAEAFRRTLLPETQCDVVLAISLEQAWEKVASVFPKARQFKGGREQKIAYREDPKKFAENLIRDNYKLEKDHRGRGRPAWVKGLSLVPVGAVFDGVSGNRSVSMPYEGLLQGGLGAAEDLWDERRDEGWHPTLCHGASVECRATCLVFSGSNVKQTYNTEVKQASAAALIRYPNEFLRVLHESIRVFREKAEYSGHQSYVRLNVYSDVPWERVAPWLFSDKKHHSYDYTKLPGRKTPENYDLTFSFSGSNWPFVVSELRRGRRAAVVFFMPDSPEMRRISKGELSEEQYAKVKAAIRRQYYAGQKWYGLPIVDGDIDDVRPRDPGQCWVGLTWKPTKGSAGVRPRTFVLYCYLIDGRLAVAHTPRATKLSEEDAELSGVAIMKAKAFREKERPVKRAFRVPDEAQRRLPLAKNSDEELRKLQRAALSGDTEASTRLARERARAGMDNIRLTLQRLADTDEWRVNYWVNNKRDDEKSYYTSDKADAVATMAAMQKEIDAGPTAKNPDEAMRGRARRAASGDVQDRARVLKDRLRTGRVSVDHLGVAAWLGDEAAGMVVPKWVPGPKASNDLEAQEMFHDWRSSVYIALRWAPIRRPVLQAFSIGMAEHVLPLLEGDKDAESVVWRLKNGEGSEDLTHAAYQIMSFYYGENDSSHRAAGDVLREAALVAQPLNELEDVSDLARWAADTSFSGARAFAPPFEAGDAWWTTVPAEEREFQRNLLVGLLTGDVPLLQAPS